MLAKVFDKTEYRKRRKQGKRGQGDEPSEVLSFTKSDTRMVYDPDPIKGGKFKPANRKQRRKRVIDRGYTRKGYHVVERRTKAGYLIKKAVKAKVKRKK